MKISKATLLDVFSIEDINDKLQNYLCICILDKSCPNDQDFGRIIRELINRK